MQCKYMVAMGSDATCRIQSCFDLPTHWATKLLASIPGRKEKGGLVYFVCTCVK